MSSTNNSSISSSETTSSTTSDGSSRLQQRLKAKRDRQTLNLIVAMGRALERDPAWKTEAEAVRTREMYNFRRGQIVERTPDTAADLANKGAPALGKAPWWGWAKKRQGCHFILVEPAQEEDKEAMLVADLADIRDMHLEDDKRRALGNALVAVPRVNQRMLGFYIPRDDVCLERPLMICEGLVVDIKQDYQFCFVEPVAGTA